MKIFKINEGSKEYDCIAHLVLRVFLFLKNINITMNTIFKQEHFSKRTKMIISGFQTLLQHRNQTDSVFLVLFFMVFFFLFRISFELQQQFNFHRPAGDPIYRSNDLCSLVSSLSNRWPYPAAPFTSPHCLQF